MSTDKSLVSAHNLGTASPFTAFSKTTESGFSALARPAIPFSFAGVNEISTHTSPDNSSSPFTSSRIAIANRPASSYDPSKPTPFLSIPSELRVNTYKFLFAWGTVHVRDRSLPGSLMRRTQLSSILQACRLTYDEARGPFYNTIEFVLAYSWGLVPHPDAMVPIRNPFTVDARSLLENLTFTVRDFRFMPEHEELRGVFPRLKRHHIKLPEDIRRRLPFDFIGDMSTIMKKTPWIHAHEEDYSAPRIAEASLLRWMQRAAEPSFPKYLTRVFKDMWQWSNFAEAHEDDEHERQCDYQLSFVMSYLHCAQYFDVPPLRRSPTGWAHDDEYSALYVYETPCTTHAIPDCRNDVCFVRARDDPAWQVLCAFDARSWSWTFQVNGRVWLCNEQSGESCFCETCTRTHHIKFYSAKKDNSSDGSGDEPAEQAEDDGQEGEEYARPRLIPELFLGPVQNFRGTVTSIREFAISEC